MNGDITVISQVGFWWNKSLLWDSSWSSEKFYGKFRKRGAKKAFSSELFDYIIAVFKESSENFKAKKKETKFTVKVEAFLWKTL